MSRPHGHRKSQSTSALSFIADGGALAQQQAAAKGKSRASQHPALHRVGELPSSSSSASMASLPGLTHPKEMKERDKDGEKKRKLGTSRPVNEEDVGGWMADIMSLRSSERRRGAALRGIEKALVGACSRAHKHADGALTLDTFLSMNVHPTLISLLIRHAQTISFRQAAVSELGNVISELSSVVGLLQGMCLLSQKCKTAVGEAHVLEILIDLLLLLRTQPPMPTSERTEPRSIVYNLLDLLCCVLVDSPDNSRTFERLSGLEAVTRVLKGTGVAKEIRMKCVEFLYFYLQPENAAPNRAVSGSSTSSSSSNDSALYPPSPLSSSTSSIMSSGGLSPAMFGNGNERFPDLDVPFVPQTPKKAPQPSLGYLTPSTRRVSGASTHSASTTPALPPVPGSPTDMKKSESTVFAQPRPRDSKSPAPRPRDARRSSVLMSTPSQPAGLGLGLPKSSSMAAGLSSAGATGLLKRDVTAIKLDAPNPSDPFKIPEARHSRASSVSSSSCTVVPPGRSVPPSPALSSRSGMGGSSGMARSSTTSNLSGDSVSRKVSVRRPSKLSSIPSSSNLDLASQAGPSISEPSATTESASAPAPAPRAPRIRHSRTQSHLSGLPPPPPQLSDIDTPRSRKVTPPPVAAQPQPTPAKRAFPVELTRGIPPSKSSPALAPLGPSRRIPSESDRRSGGASDLAREKAREDEKKTGLKGVKSVEEKKEMLSSWIGNVDALVQGVENVGFWGNKNGAVPRRRG